MLRALCVTAAVVALTVVAGGAPATAEPPAAAPSAPAIPAAPAIAPAPAPTLVAGTPCSPSARACADLSSNQAWLIRDGQVVYGPTRIVHGKKGHRTPAGTFRVFFKNRHHVSSIYDVAMPNAVFFNGNIAFHQGPLRGGSHGCVRLSKAASQVFFGALRYGDVVQVVR
ncbi:MAG: L,D-transpeptidase [Pseudonocardia sp.]